MMYRSAGTECLGGCRQGDRNIAPIFPPQASSPTAARRSKHNYQFCSLPRPPLPKPPRPRNITTNFHPSPEPSAAAGTQDRTGERCRPNEKKEPGNTKTAVGRAASGGSRRHRAPAPGIFALLVCLEFESLLDFPQASMPPPRAIGMN